MLLSKENLGDYTRPLRVYTNGVSITPDEPETTENPSSVCTPPPTPDQRKHFTAERSQLHHEGGLLYEEDQTNQRGEIRNLTRSPQAVHPSPPSVPVRLLEP